MAAPGRSGSSVRTPWASSHAALLQFFPHGSDLIALDVGSGAGRDAAWLASLGYDVVAVEPAAGMRVEGQRRIQTCVSAGLRTACRTLPASSHPGVTSIANYVVLFPL
jgi:protein-L-isoaspartate O-methyltransferase